ncbi:hypothetical protein GLAREA_09314 [Glarea lozoyensis ATCC 20868]|uniref:Uncharacterized protein n=1 Tax=Glarea lozoyensis (strain ATCC 20868 / MF5171) TaxID=1116229 RepID=S3DYY6_GLAL2|nr:uncharacterized protein GLAREA_09314 [Glarea lozoyensis ATCC 20868]EPE37151.1 hypothetical protein GLAREA_09314 [Glarea lozoyensis ATCC 20868]
MSSSSDKKPKMRQIDLKAAEQRIIIHPAGDLILRPYKKNNEFSFEGAGVGKNIIQGKIFAELKVKKSVLIEHSTTFKMMLTGGFKEANQSVVDLESEYLVGLEIWLRFLHGTMNEGRGKIRTADLFDVIEASHFYFFKLELLNDWFKSCFTYFMKNTKPEDIYELGMLVYPCRQFDYAEGFMAVTKKLVFETAGHISIWNPHPHIRHLQIAPRIVGGVNGARVNLTHKLHDGLYIHLRFLVAGCKCRKEGLFAYEQALHATKAWPLMTKTYGKGQLSVQSAIDLLEDFKYHPPVENCKLCSSNFKDVVHLATETVLKDFQGLCLDCIKKPERKDVTQIHWDLGCRTRHKRSTWWYSWLSSDQPVDTHEQARDERRVNSRYVTPKAALVKVDTEKQS